MVVISPDKCQECLNRASSVQLPTNSYSFLILIVPQSTTTRSIPCWTVKELTYLLVSSSWTVRVLMSHLTRSSLILEELRNHLASCQH